MLLFEHNICKVAMLKVQCKGEILSFTELLRGTSNENIYKEDQMTKMLVNCAFLMCLKDKCLPK